MKTLYLRILAFFYKAFPFSHDFFRNNDFRGKGSLIQYLKLPDEAEAQCGGIKYRLDLRDDVQQQIYFNVYERDNVSFVLNLLKPGDIFFDAGANVGAYTLQAAKKLNGGSSIFSFEPEPDNFNKLDRNCSQNEFSASVNRYRTALTNFDGTAQLFKSMAKHSGWHSLTEFKDISTGKIDVPAIKLDSFVKQLGIKRIDLMKIDVEANEFELLEGAADSLTNRIIKRIFIEFNGNRLREKGKTFKDFTDTFAKYCYFPAGINLKLVKKLLDGSINQESVCENFLFEADA